MFIKQKAKPRDKRAEMSALPKSNAHVVDVLGNVAGRDQPILRMEKAIELVSLLSEEIFLNKDTVFFDPFCKAGELLLSCAYMSCAARVNKESRLMDINSIYEEIFASNRYFALAPDERHHRLSLRTFLGNSNSHDERYNHIIRNGSYLSEINGRLDKDIFKKELEDMIEYIKGKSENKRIIAVGNPPYQESDGGFGKSARPVYDCFTTSLIESRQISEFALVIPARWFVGGKGLEPFRKKILMSGKVKNLIYFKKSKEVFPTVDINGGICYFHYNKSHLGNTYFTDGKSKTHIRLDMHDVVCDDPAGYNLVDKVTSKWQGKYVSDVAWAGKPFGIRTFYFNRNHSTAKDARATVPCLSRNMEIKYANRDDISKNQEAIDLWKVSVPAVAGKGGFRSTVPLKHIFLLEKGVITTETYNIIDAFETKAEAECLINYLKTDFARYFVGLRKITQHLPRDRWQWVPYLDISKEWTDKKLFKYFGFNNQEIKHIIQKVLEWSY